MVIRSITPVEKTTQFTYQMVWPMNRDLCLYFIDAAIAEATRRKAMFCDIVIREDIDSDVVSLREKFVEEGCDTFKTLADTQFATIAVVLADDESHTQMYIELMVDSDVCNVQLMQLTEDGKIDEDADLEDSAPDLLMDAIEILAHVTHTCQNL